MRVVFLGTPEFAVPVLDALAASRHEVIAVISQPDRPKGRGNKVQMTPVAARARRMGITPYQPEKLRTAEGVAYLKALAPDVMVTAAYGQILSQRLLDIPQKGTINVHASLLPKYRGAAPVQWALINGEKTVGVTTMLTARGVDCGDMLLQQKTDVLPGENAGALLARLAPIGAALLLKTLEGWEGGTIAPIPQDEAQATHYPMLDKSHGRLDFSDTAVALENRVRGVTPAPGATMELGGQVYKVLAARAVEGAGQAGRLLVCDDRRGLVIACGSGALEIMQLQAPGGKPMAARDYLRGHPGMGNA
nr:methionyl-tRNA formyltransferase [bacterium]